MEDCGATPVEVNSRAILLGAKVRLVESRANLAIID
jgi:hypothetical protein